MTRCARERRSPRECRRAFAAATRGYDRRDAAMMQQGRLRPVRRGQAPDGGTTTARRPVAHVLLERIASLQVLDGPARRIAGGVRAKLPRGAADDLLSGYWLGHSLHPVLVIVPIGAWTGATLLDLVRGGDSARSSEALLAAGVVAAGPSVLAGLRDWAASERDEVRRTGLLHGLTNFGALALYGASLVARRRGRPRAGVLLARAGFGFLTVGDWLGGNLVLAHGAGVSRTAFEHVVADWAPALAADALADGRPVRGAVAGIDIVVVRRDGGLFALADRCSDCGAALHEGQLVGDCIQCPRHGTRFRLADGARATGPSSYPQPAFEARLRDGRVEVRSAAAGLVGGGG